MNKKGFTLIELLAVIVILAIIMVIATPAIANVIEDARKGAFKNSAQGIIKAAEQKYMLDKLETKNENLVFEYENGEIVGENDLNYKGTRPENGKVMVNTLGQVALAIHNGKYCVIKGYEETEVDISEKLLEDCEIPIPPFICGNDFIDSRDGNTYETVYITDDEGDNGQCWFAEDLRYDCSLEDGYNNIDSGTSWSGTNNCGNQGEGYTGLLYQWPVAMNGSETKGSQGLCPEGWHIPTDDEWITLTNSVGFDPGTELKNGPFNAKLAGYRDASGTPNDGGSGGYWWTSSPDGSGAWRHKLYLGDSNVYRDTRSQARGSSVRCVSEQ